MATAACLPIAADRAGPCVRTIFFEGLDLTGITLALEMRLNPETPGPASIALGMGATANAEGLRLVGVTYPNGVPVSQVVMRINETTMEDGAKVPYTGELGSSSILYYDLIGIFGQDKRRLAYGTFTALPTVYGMDAAPANRPESFGGASSSGGATWTSARLVLSEDVARVIIDGADLIGGVIVRAQAAADQATDLATGLPLTYTSPNLWPDPALSTAGWSGPVVAGVSADGRRTIAVTGADAKYRLPIALVGSAGSIFSAGVDIERAAFAGGAPVAVLLRQLRSDTTLIVDTLLAIFVEGDATPTTSRVLARGAGMIVDTEAALLELYLLASGDPENSVTMSLPGLYRGASAAFRPVIARSPDSARVADYYVDARPGATAASDTNAGVSPDAPFRSVTAALGALAATGNLPNRTIAIRRGSVLRGQTIESPAAGLSVVAYGEGSAPRSLGSMAYSRSRLTDAGGGVFTLPLGYKPSTCALVEITTGNVTKLFNPDSNDVPPATGNWGWASDTLHIKPGFDPAGYMLEVPRNDGTGYGFHAAAERQTVAGIMFEHWRDHGASTNHPDTRWIDTWCNWNGFDGFDQDAGAERFLIRGGGAIGNGRRYGSDLGPGDGSSAHLRSNGIIEGATFKWNTQTGVGDLYDTNVEVRFCYFEDNNVDLQVYAHNGGSYDGSQVQPGHSWHHNVHVHKVRGSVFAVNATQAALSTSIHNLTIYATAPQFALGTISGTQVDLANVLVQAPGTTFAFASYVATDGSVGKVTSRNVIVNGVAAVWQSGGYDASRGGGSEANLLVADPRLVDPEGGDFSLAAGSPAIGSGVSLGYIRDYAGRPVAGQPSRGALEYAA